MPLSLVKTMNPFGRAVIQIFNFFSGKVTYAPPCILMAPLIRQYHWRFLSVLPNALVTSCDVAYKALLQHIYLPDTTKYITAKMVKRCPNCNAVDSLVQIVSRACDGNYIIYPNGQESNGYLPDVAGLCNSDGLAIEICIACGQLNGLDRVALKEKLSQIHRDEE